MTDHFIKAYFDHWIYKNCLFFIKNENEMQPQSKYPGFVAQYELTFLEDVLSVNKH